MIQHCLEHSLPSNDNIQYTKRNKNVQINIILIQFFSMKYFEETN